MWPSSATATVLLARWACVQPVRGSSVEAEAGASLLCQAIGVWKMGNLKPHMKTAVLAISPPSQADGCGEGGRSHLTPKVGATGCRIEADDLGRLWSSMLTYTQSICEGVHISCPFRLMRQILVGPAILAFHLGTYQ